MLLGAGTACTDEEILAEFDRYYAASCAARGYRPDPRYLRALRVLQDRIGKPILEWTEDDWEQQYSRFPTSSSSMTRYTGAETFLLLRGYFRPSLTHLLQAPLDVGRSFAGLLDPLRRGITQAVEAAGLRMRARHAAGMELTVLLALTLYLGRPVVPVPALEAPGDDGHPGASSALCAHGVPTAPISPTHFEEFLTSYAAARRAALPHTNYPLGPAGLMTHVRVCLEAWGVLDSAPTIPTAHERRMSQVQSPTVHDALHLYLTACTAQLRPSAVTRARDAVLRFFVWAQDYLRHSSRPPCTALSDITRDVALAYAADLRARRYTPNTIYTMHGDIRRFYAFAIEERLASAPSRNPFSPRDVAQPRDKIPRYFSNTDVQRMLAYCAGPASLLDRVLIITLLHTGIRAGELAALRASDIVESQGRWKLHVHLDKGFNHRAIPLTDQCVGLLREWCATKGRTGDASLFTWGGRDRPWTTRAVAHHCHQIGQRVGIARAYPHRYRYTFAMALLNYGMRETVLQTLLGHIPLNLTLEYAKILDTTVENAIGETRECLPERPLSWVSRFFTPQDYTHFAEGDALSWIRLPMGFCRRNPQLHCESDVKCFLCERFYLTPDHLPRLREMQERYVQLALPMNAFVVRSWIERLERAQQGSAGAADDEPMPNGNPPLFPERANGFVPLASITTPTAGRQPVGARRVSDLPDRCSPSVSGEHA